MPLYIYGSLTTITPSWATNAPDLYKGIPVISGSISGIDTINVTSGTYTSGSSVSYNSNYNVYVFTGNSSLTFNVANNTLCFVLAVGGGGGGASVGGGGGGAGGVVMKSVSLTSGSKNMSITIGGGGGQSSNGTPTTISLNGTNIIYATGGGAGGTNQSTGVLGGSKGGDGYSVGFSAGYVPYNVNQNSNNYNYVNGSFLQKVGVGVLSGGGGGGGAGTEGSLQFSNDVTGNKYIPGNGGNGIKCFLPGIKDYVYLSNPISSYYWGGGGGGATAGPVGISAGSGGLGGGGGGAIYQNSGTGGTGGTGGINNGGNGAINNGTGGNGGANTGSGGGGAWNGTAGSGGSGIVIIAFPVLNIYTNTNSLLTNTSLSSTTYSNIKTALHYKLINYDYYGPIFNLRPSNDISGVKVTPFYADLDGNLGTSYFATGQSVSTWLSINSPITTYAYITKWYDQGMDICFNCAVQFDISNQPIYDVNTKCINFGYTGVNGGITSPSTNYFLYFPPNIGLPTGNINFTNIFKTFNVPQSVAGGLFQLGPNQSTNSNIIGLYNSGNYWQYSWYPTTTSYGTSTNYLQNNIVEMTYSAAANGTSAMNIYINGTSTTYTTNILNYAITTDGSSNSLGSYFNSSNSRTFFNGQLYYFYLFNTVIPTSDYNLLTA